MENFHCWETVSSIHLDTCLLVNAFGSIAHTDYIISKLFRGFFFASRWLYKHLLPTIMSAFIRENGSSLHATNAHRDSHQTGTKMMRHGSWRLAAYLTILTHFLLSQICTNYHVIAKLFTQATSLLQPASTTYINDTYPEKRRYRHTIKIYNIAIHVILSITLVTTNRI